MPWYELVGLYDCPFVGKAEKLLEQVQFQFPIIEYRKTMKDRVQWKEFIENMKIVRGWTIKRSPVIWEALVSPKGKVNYIGDIDDFCEYIHAFFGILCENDSTGSLLQQVAKNKALFGKGFQGMDRENKVVCNTTILNGSMKMLECILARLLSPISIIPPNVLLKIELYSDHLSQRELDGLGMEAIDMASENLFKIRTATSLANALYDSHLVLVLNDYTKGLNEEILDWFSRIEWSVLKHAEVMNQMVANECRVIIGGDGPQCFVAEVFRKTLTQKKVQPGHLISCGQHIVNRAKAVISRRTKVPAGCVSRIHAWGWPGSSGAYIEVKDALVRDAECSTQGPSASPCEIPIREIGLHPDWLFNVFSEEFLVSQNERIFKTRAFPKSDLCIAEAVVSTLQIWFMSQITTLKKPYNKKDMSTRIVDHNANDILDLVTKIPNDALPEIPVLEVGDTLVELDNLKLVLPVVSVGIQCPKNSIFPNGTFMVQPSVCYFGKWVPAEKVSQKTHERILREIFRLWDRRQEMIFSEPSVTGMFSDYDILIYGKSTNEEEEQEGEGKHEVRGEYEDEIDRILQKPTTEDGEGELLQI